MKYLTWNSRPLRRKSCLGRPPCLKTSGGRLCPTLHSTPSTTRKNPYSERCSTRDWRKAPWEDGCLRTRRFWPLSSRNSKSLARIKSSVPRSIWLWVFWTLRSSRTVRSSRRTRSPGILWVTLPSWLKFRTIWLARQCSLTEDSLSRIRNTWVRWLWKWPERKLITMTSAEKNCRISTTYLKEWTPRVKYMQRWWSMYSWR